MKDANLVRQRALVPALPLLAAYIRDAGEEHGSALDVIEAQAVDVLKKRPVDDDVHFPVFEPNIDALHFVYLLL